MQLCIGKLSLESRPFSLGFLNAVLAEQQVPGLKDGQDPGCLEGLGDSDQLDVGCVTTGRARRCRNPCADPLQLFCRRTRHLRCLCHEIAALTAFYLSGSLRRPTPFKKTLKRLTPHGH